MKPLHVSLKTLSAEWEAMRASASSKGDQALLFDFSTDSPEDCLKSIRDPDEKI